MKKQKLKSKIFLSTLAAILLVSCGGGGGSGSSNLPIKPDNIGNNISPIPKKPSIPGVSDEGVSDEKENSKDAKVEENKPEIEKKDDIEALKNLSLSELRKKFAGDEEKVKAYLLAERGKSTENIPVDTVKRNGAEIKVAVLDGDFINRKQFLENKYGKIEILDRNAKPKVSDHGELVLSALREYSNIGIIAGSIGEDEDGRREPSTAVVPKIEMYEKALEKFSPNQKVKIFNQSWGVPEEVEKYKGASENLKMHALAPGQSADEGRKIFEFYKEQVNKDTLFIWANGNTSTNNRNEIVFF